MKVKEKKPLKSLFKLLIGCLMTFSLLVGGAALMKYVERPEEIIRETDYAEISTKLEEAKAQLYDDLFTKLNSSDQEFLDYLFDLTLEYASTEVADPSDPNWDMNGSLYFCFTILTTIGYGDFSPTTSEGKVICIFLAMFGIPCFVYTMILANAFINVFLECRCMAEKKLKIVILICLIVFIIVMIILFSVGLKETENWTYLEAVYFSVITFSTVGLGDYVPNSTSSAQATFTFFVIFGILVFGMLIDTLISLPRIKKRSATIREGGKYHRSATPLGRWQTVL